MQQLKRLLAVCALAFLSSVSARAEFTVLETSATGIATFNSNTQKAARNQHGTLIAYVKSRNAALTAQEVTFKLIDRTGTVSTIMTETRGANAPCVEASSTGEFFAVISDFAAGYLTALVWRDISASTTPERVDIWVGGSGKIACAFDNSRRTLFYLGTTGTLVKWRVDHAVTATSQVWNPPYALDNRAEYPSLTLSQDGVLNVFWNTVTGGSNSYRSIQYLASPDGGNFWSRVWKPVGYIAGAASLPVVADESGASTTLTRGEDHNATAFMLSAYADAGNVAAVWSFSPGFEERCFVNFRRCSAAFVRYSKDELTRHSTASSAPARELVVPVTLGEKVLRPLGGGGLFRRGGKLHFITTEQADVVVSRLEGDEFVEIRRAPIPAAGAGRCPFQLSIFRGSDADGDVIGTFTTLNVSCSAWATMPDNSAVTGDVVFFRVTL